MQNPILSRREVLKTASCGFGSLAFAGLASEASGDVNPLAPKTPHFLPHAKRVIFLFMSGGPSHVDSFDYKPQLAADQGKEYLDPYKQRQRKLEPSAWKFRQYGECGLWVSDLFPEVARHADELCVINGMQTDIPNHPQAHLQMHTGEFRFVRPSLGSWLLYGLGSESQSLPGYVIMSPPSKGGAQNYGSAFLPATYQATRVGEKFPYAARGSEEMRRRELDLIQSMNKNLLERHKVNAELEGVIHSFELGFRMQDALPKLMNISGETKQTQAMYGIGNKVTGRFSRQCLIARRLAEAGVRFIEVSFSKDIWDTHRGHWEKFPQLCQSVDQPIAALLTDLKQRGLLQETLVLWGGEFGRTPGVLGPGGRDHNASGFTMWMAGGGVKGGLRFGATDEHGVHAIQDKVHVHDLHATMLHLLGLDHQKLTYQYGGRDYSLTDIHDARVVHEIIS